MKMKKRMKKKGTKLKLVKAEETLMSLFNAWENEIINSKLNYPESTIPKELVVEILDDNGNIQKLTYKENENEKDQSG